MNIFDMEELSNPPRRILLGFAALFAFGAFPANAQDSNSPSAPLEIPADPLLKAAPDFSKWTVNYVYPKQPATNCPPLSGDETHRMTVTKTGNIVSEDVVDGRGCHTETWYVGALQYRKPPGKSNWFESSPTIGANPVSTDYSPLPPNGFRAWDWIGRESYAGKVALESGESFVFVPGGAQKLNLSNPGRLKELIAAQPLVAYVNAETRLPVALCSGGVTQRVVFDPPPNAVQTLPADLLDQIRKGEEARRRLYQPAPRPY